MAEESFDQNNENELMNGYDQEDRVEEADGDQEDGDDLDQNQNGVEEDDLYEEDAQNGEEEVEGDQEDEENRNQNGIEEADWDQEEEDDPDQIEVQEADGDQEFEEDRDQNGDQNEENEDSRKRTPDGGAICPSCGAHIKYLRNLNRHLKACCPKRREEGKLLPMNPITARIKKQITDGDQEDEDGQNQNGIEKADWDQEDEEADLYQDGEDDDDRDQNGEEEEADMDQEDEEDPDQNEEEEADGDQNEENNDSRKRNRSACRTPDGGVICPRCGIHLKIYYSLGRHLKMHCSKERIDEEDDRNKDDRLTCQYCGKCYYRRGMLYQHQEQVHGIKIDGIHVNNNNKPAQCPDCFKILSSKYCLEYHRKVGCRVKKMAESQYKCSQCEFTAIGKYDLGRHIQKTHREQKSFKCYYCDKSFLRKYQREEHMRTHTGEKPYKCHACGREYFTPKAMQEHLRLRRCAPKPPTESKDKKPTRKRDMKKPKREKIEIRKEKKVKKEKKMKKVKKEHDVSLIKLVGRPLF